MNPRQWLDNLRSVELSELDINNVGAWPASIRGIAVALLIIVVLALGYNFYLQDQINLLDQGQTEEMQLKDQFASKARMAANLEALEAQMQEMEATFGAMLRQLPSDTEVPGLLEDISKTGLNAGLTFEEIKLLPEVTQPFYIELPIQITVTGNYHDLASFVSGVSSLPRIVTLHDFDIKPVNDGTSNPLRMSILAKTYRYNEKAAQVPGVPPAGSPGAAAPGGGK